MKKVFLSLIVLSLLIISACDKNNEEDPPNDPIDPLEGYSLVFSEEFDGPDINSVNWNYETGDGTEYGLPAGWGNDEQQIYTNSSENSGIENDNGLSVLAITAREDNSGGYTSAKLTTNDLLSIRFGRLEVKAKLPQGQGIWPAIWLLGDNRDQVDWPGCGEIDILEVLGHQPSILYSTLHYTTGDQEKGEIQSVYELSSGSFADDYHAFALDWTPESLTFSLDGQQIYQTTIEDDMKEFLRSSYLVMNVAVGGNWPGDPDSTTIFPQTMFVDYVRLYSKDDLEIPDAPPLDIEEETIGQIIEPNIGDNAIRDDFTELGSLAVISYGGGGEPDVTTSSTAIDGDLSLVFDFPGGSWGGAYIELAEATDLSNYTHIKFSLNKPASMVNGEIKLESPSSNFSIYLADYTGSPVAEGFVEYTVPLSDFEGLEINEITIPFAIWNPQDANSNFVSATVLIDNVYFTN